MRAGRTTRASSAAVVLLALGVSSGLAQSAAPTSVPAGFAGSPTSG